MARTLPQASPAALPVVTLAFASGVLLGSLGAGSREPRLEGLVLSSLFGLLVVALRRATDGRPPRAALLVAALALAAGLLHGRAQVGAPSLGGGRRAHAPSPLTPRSPHGSTIPAIAPLPHGPLPRAQEERSPPERVPAALHERPPLAWTAGAPGIPRRGVPRISDPALAPTTGGLRSPLVLALELLRERCLQRLERCLPREHVGLVPALCLGDRRGIPPQVTDLFTRTGVRHLLALSGLHVGLVLVSLLLPMLRWLEARWPSRSHLLRLACCASLLLLVPLCGGAPPLRRATLGASAALLLTLRARIGRPSPVPDRWSLLSAGFLLECLFAPSTLLSPATLLTYAATAGLLHGLRSSTGVMRPALPQHEGLALLACLGGILCQGVRASCAASLATLPLTWTLFGEMGLAGIVLTPLIAPVIGGIVVCGLAATLAESSVMGGLAEALSSLVRFVLHAADQLPFNPLVLPDRPWWWIAAAAGLLLRGRGGSFPAGLALLGALLLPWHLRASRPHLELLDVGHGTCVLIETPDCGVFVFDAGSGDRLALGPVIRRRLAALECEDLHLVLSHADKDHTSAAEFLSTRFRCQPHPVLLERPLGEWRLAQGAVTCMTWVRGRLEAGNEGSAALRIETGQASALLTGDTEGEGLRALLSRLPSTDLVLLPHHGHDLEAARRLLGVTQARLAWVSTSLEEEHFAGLPIPVRTTREGPLSIDLPTLPRQR